MYTHCLMELRKDVLLNINLREIYHINILLGKVVINTFPPCPVVKQCQEKWLIIIFPFTLDIQLNDDSCFNLLLGLNHNAFVHTLQTTLMQPGLKTDNVAVSFSI